MKILLSTLFFLMAHVCWSQERKPIFKSEGLANKSNKWEDINESDLSLVVYGSISCGFSSLLIKTLYDNYDSISDKYKNLYITLLMDQDLELINNNMQKYFDTFPIYSNAILNIPINKSDVVPQTFLYKENKLIMHFNGVNKAKLDKLFKKVKKLAANY